MSRSLYGLLHRKYGKRIDAATRRDFLKATLAASAGMLLSNSRLFGDEPRPKSVGLRVAVIGAGFAGLACAYELIAAGYDVTVIESRDRVGGRVLSFGDFVKGKNVEGGGELIGSNHPTWVAYKEQFGLEWLDVTEGEEEAPILLNGKRLTEEESNKLWEDLDAASNRLNELSMTVSPDQPWTANGAAALDAKTTKAWIDELDVSPLCRHGLTTQFVANNGVAIEKQSFLGNLTQISGGGGEKYWTESEVFRCKGGNQQLAFKLAEKIGAGRLILGLPVNAIDGQRDKMIVSCADGRTIEVDDVVLTIPPTTWQRIDISPPLPNGLRPQMGTNLKYLAAVKKRFWQVEKLSPDSLTDQFMSMTWEGTDNQPGDDGASLNCFSGGPPAEQALAIPKNDRDAEYAKFLETLYPGFKENFEKSRFMDWPNEKWTAGGYSFPAPGQVTTIGPILARGSGRLHFAGEHTCYKFVGYMEGGLNSGVTIARKLAARDGVKIRHLEPAPVPAAATEPSTAPATAPSRAPEFVK